MTDWTLPVPRAETPQPRLPDGGLPPTLGPVVVRWMEAMLVHGEGDLAGEPYRVPEWVKRALYRIYEYDPATYRRTVREALIVTPKGTSKTESAAALALAEMAGPTVPGPDGPSMRRSPVIPVAAASYEQTDRLYGGNVKPMVDEGPLGAHLEAFEREVLFRDGRPGRVSRLAAVAGTNEGDLPTATVCDEIHEWSGRRERVHLVLSQAQEKRGGLLVNITTPDDANPESLLGRKRDYGDRVAEGTVADPGFYYLHYAAPEACPLETPDERMEAQRQATPIPWRDPGHVDRIVAEGQTPEHEVRRYWLGQYVKAEGLWDPAKVWDDLAAPRPVPEGERVVLAFDGSYRRDSTALVGCTVDDLYMFTLAVWEKPDDARDTWKVSRVEVDAEVRAAMELFDVVELAPDPPGWHAEIEGWEETFGEPVVRFDTAKYQLMADACSRFYNLTVPEADRQVTHDGAPVIGRHLRNCVQKETNWGTVVTKEHKDSPRKIDAAIAAVVAVARASWHRDHAHDRVLDGPLAV